MAKQTQASFDTLQKELQQVVAKLQDTTDIDAAIKLYERGIELTALIQQYLETAQNSVTKVNKKFEQID